MQQAYEDKRMHHVGEQSGLEEQMTTWNAADGSESPDRVDALVWGAYELDLVTITGQKKPVVASHTIERRASKLVRSMRRR